MQNAWRYGRIRGFFPTPIAALDKLYKIFLDKKGYMVYNGCGDWDLEVCGGSRNMCYEGYVQIGILRCQGYVQIGKDGV